MALSILYMSKKVGEHALVECQGPIAEFNQAQLIALLRQAASASKATVLGHNFHAFGEGMGVTGVLILAESHITVHTWPELNYAAFDIFMCGDCDPTMAAETITTHTGCRTYSVSTYDRGFSMIKPLSIETALTSPHTPTNNAHLIQNLIDNKLAQNENQAKAKAKAKAGLLETVKFLYLCANSPDSITPSTLVEDFWREFILFTKLYQAFCEQVFGRFIHHEAADTPREKVAQYQKTVFLYQKNFGEINPEFWVEYTTDTVGGSKCIHN
ncbi:MAG: S-adenosylmethionine decarboxylase [Flavobacteriales bacterium]|jgi:S-adenosylmethionine decarboxylase